MVAVTELVDRLGLNVRLKWLVSENPQPDSCMT
jgi:hypothetical protein